MDEWGGQWGPGHHGDAEYEYEIHHFEKYHNEDSPDSELNHPEDIEHVYFPPPCVCVLINCDNGADKSSLKCTTRRKTRRRPRPC